MGSEGAEDEGCVSGAMVMQHRTVLVQRFGDELWDVALQQLEPERRQELAGLMPLGWLRMSTLEAMYGALAERTGTTVSTLHTEVARESVERALRTIWRLMLRFTTDSALLARAPILYSRTYSKGELRAEVPENGRAEITLRGWPGVPEIAQRGLRVGVETVLKVAGRQGVRVTSTPTPSGAVFHASWRL